MKKIFVMLLLYINIVSSSNLDPVLLKGGLKRIFSTGSSNKNFESKFHYYIKTEELSECNVCEPSVIYDHERSDILMLLDGNNLTGRLSFKIFVPVDSNITWVRNGFLLNDFILSQCGFLMAWAIRNGRVCNHKHVDNEYELGSSLLTKSKKLELQNESLLEKYNLLNKEASKMKEFISEVQIIQRDFIEFQKDIQAEAEKEKRFNQSLQNQKSEQIDLLKKVRDLESQNFRMKQIFGHVNLIATSFMQLQKEFQQDMQEASRFSKPLDGEKLDDILEEALQEFGL